MDLVVWIYFEFEVNVLYVVIKLVNKYKGKLLLLLYGIFFLVKDIIDVVGVLIIVVCLSYVYIF